MNLGFDLGMYRSLGPDFRYVLSGRHTLLDLSYINYLESEVRPERSLKNIGHILGTHIYDEKDLDRLPTIRAILDYNGQDTHNTLSSISTIAARCLSYGPEWLGAKLSPSSIQFYSDTIWSCLFLTEAGVPFHRPSLLALASRLLADLRRASAACSSHSLLLSGKNSDKSKATLLSSILDHLDATHPDFSSTDPARSIRSHPLLVYTEKTRQVSFSEENINFLLNLLPPRSIYARLLRISLLTTRRNKLLSSYLYPYLWHQRPAQKPKPHHLLDRTCLLVPPSPLSPHPEDCPCSPSSTSATTTSTTSPSAPPRSTPSASTPPTPASRAASPSTSSPVSPTTLTSPSTPTTSASSATGAAASPPPPSSPTSPPPPPPKNPLLGTRNPDVHLSHPTWFIVPTQFKDGGKSGGTEQGRVTCKKGAHQTDPPEIRRRVRSRWHGGVIASVDLSQIELRVAALLSGDQSLLAEYAKPKPDLHTDRAIRIFGHTFLVDKYGLDFRSVYAFKEDSRGERQVGKHVNFSDLFRSGPHVMQATVLEISGVLRPLSFFEQIVRERPHARPGLWLWQENLLHEARRTGRVILPITGQSRYFEGGDKYEGNEIVNFPVQTTAGNVLLRIQHHVRLLLDHHPLILPFLNVYDALKFDLQSPSLLPHLTSVLSTAVHTVATSDYWGILSSHLGRSVPLTYDLKTS